MIIARSDDRVVVGVGEAAASAALAPASKLGDSELYGQAKHLLDDPDPTLLLSMPDLVKASRRPAAPTRTRRRRSRTSKRSP